MNTIKTAAFAAVAAMSVTGAAQAEEASYVLATASTGGTYYPVGVALSTLVKVKLEPEEKIGMSAISSAGSGENVRLLRENEAQFAIMQGLFGSYAATGTGPISESGPQENLRSVTMLWQNVEQFLVSADAAGDGTVAALADLKGKAMAMGAQNSGTIGSNRTLLEGLGVNIEEDYELVFGGYGPSVEALQNAQVMGVGIPAGVPTGAISQLMASAGDSVTPLEVTDEQMATMDGGRDLWTRYVIPAGTYPGQEADWNTIAQPNFLATNADVSEENVYLITKTIFENLPFLQAIHPATKAMALDKAIAGLPVPLHPGAARYYQEQGVEIPERLMAK
ncbi:MAG: TAXI family TRAP transporter solute-binding subunit [Silicimonas sp.]|nr:TAXI family TRAP transporter solute-binding subunit [Silicimonas sp.]NNF91231.1 TAXI family TRAP transporter solute-binding subunit [Boseongicola sp.]RZW11827.1 MAG: TAXI family TRAP transporter solute-binding subunit [Paracoccaceae bacterium]NND18587.1 TAXI family TRAP transporter solute-binding subunit [Silicimonas sp.]NND23044.1 TAXI family TRAP transporter solute-binding subunit [Silicimonas sp.]